MKIVLSLELKIQRTAVVHPQMITTTLVNIYVVNFPFLLASALKYKDREIFSFSPCLRRRQNNIVPERPKPDSSKQNKAVRDHQCHQQLLNFTFLDHRLRLPKIPCASYPRFNDGGSRVQNALHLPQGRDDKKITGDNGGHGVS